MRKAYYQATAAEFIQADTSFILGELTRAHGFALEHQQRQAWLDQIALVKEAIGDHAAAHILFEFSIPRMGKRADVVIALPNAILVVEFKVGATAYDAYAIQQVHDYALDLKNFHLGSHDAPIVPVLYATNAPPLARFGLHWRADRVAEPIKIGEGEFADLLAQIASANTGANVDYAFWLSAGYKPTPTIVDPPMRCVRIDRDEIARCIISRIANNHAEFRTRGEFE
ncbi:MAG: hypothetical protein KF694_08580 [Mesorhizobium sp.]|nr:hypothetical protein [Mesorhizobium sp.]